MVAAAELSGQLLMVSQSRRYWRSLSALRQQIAQLGPIGIVDCSFFKAPRFGGFRDGDARSRCWSTWRSTSSTWPAI